MKITIQYRCLKLYDFVGLDVEMGIKEHYFEVRL
jgi:hypothetical protein